MLRLQKPEAMTRKNHIHHGSGNGFADLELPGADEYLAKSELAVRIFKIIKRRRLTKVAAGKLRASANPRCPCF